MSFRETLRRRLLGTQTRDSAAAAPPAPAPRPDAPPAATPPAATPPRHGVRWLAHTLPDGAPAGAVLAVKVTLENAGAMVWQPHEPAGRTVDLVVRFGDTMVATHKLPRGEIWPGQQVTAIFTLPLPEQPGRLLVQLELVEQQVTLFRDVGVAPLVHTLEVGPPSGEPGDALWQLALRHDPWHYMPTRGLARGSNGARYPVLAARARGSRLWDGAGREYIDYVMGWGAVLLGHADPRVQDAVVACVRETSPLLPWPHALEIEVARCLSEDFPVAEMVIFGKNGSDVCALAARVARVLTGRQTILFCGYHGWQDWWVEQLGFANTGVPSRERPLLHRFRFNDAADFDRLWQEHRADLAAVFIEPAGPWEGNDVGWGGEADAGFLRLLKERAHAAGALFVCDEIVTGYRHPHGSVQAATGLTADLTCLGKSLASGYPLSALVGRAELLKNGLPRTAYGPTFREELTAFAAARASIEAYRSQPVAGHVRDYGTRLREGLVRLCRELGLAATVTGPPFRSYLRFDEPDRDRLPKRKALYVQELLRRGISTYNGIMLPSLAHGEAEMTATLEALGGALEQVAEAARRDDFDERLEIPPLLDLA